MIVLKFGNRLSKVNDNLEEYKSKISAIERHMPDYSISISNSSASIHSVKKLVNTVEELSSNINRVVKHGKTKHLDGADTLLSVLDGSIDNEEESKFFDGDQKEFFENIFGIKKEKGYLILQK